MADSAAGQVHAIRRSGYALELLRWIDEQDDGALRRAEEHWLGRPPSAGGLSTRAGISARSCSISSERPWVRRAMHS